MDEQPRGGFNFKSIDRALQFIETWGLKDVELAFCVSTARIGVTRVSLDRIACKYSQ